MANRAVEVRPFRVVAVTLSTGEPLPTLVRSRDWLPLRVPTRWAIRRRRFECMPNTLAHDLQAIGLLYEWARSALQCELDDMLERFQLPTPRQMDSLIQTLRCGCGADGSLRSLGSVANDANAICRFLAWSIDPVNQGSSAKRSLTDIAERRAVLVEFFRPIARYSGASQRIRPLESNDLDRIKAVFWPLRDEHGALILPLRFDPSNPFRKETRLRNWLMIVVALDCGPRRGEILKLRLDDMPRRGDESLWVRRRPHDKDDPRRYKPSVKTVERPLVITEAIRLGLSAYLVHRGPGRRRPGGGPYLFANHDGHPLSVSAADGLLKVVARHAGIADLSWHTFRHTWAENLANDLLEQLAEPQALEYLRQLGGWRPGSNTPMHYIQNALTRRANAFLKARNESLYRHGAANEQ